MSIVTRISVLIAITLSMIAGVELFNGMQLRQSRLQELRSDTVQLARIAELDIVRILDGAHQLLATLARLPTEHGWDDRTCAVVGSTASRDFEYDHIVGADLDGFIRCSSSKTPLTFVADFDLLDRVIKSKGYSIGTYGVGAVSGNEVIRVGYPVVNKSNDVTGVVYAGINVTWLNTALSQWQLGAQATIIITDRNGTVIARHPDSQGVGQPIAERLRPFVSAPAMGTTEVADSQGNVQLYGYVPVNAGLSSGLGVFVGRDQRPVFAEINRSIWLNVAAVVTGLLLSAIFAAIYVRRFLARPFQSLLATAGHWRDGNWSARTSAASGIPEFDELAAAFDSMADTLENRDQLLHRRDAMMDTITKCAAELVTTDTIAEAIPRILERVGQALQADRVLVLQVESAGSPIRLRNAWKSSAAIADVTAEYFASLPEVTPPEIVEWLAPLGGGRAVAKLQRDVSGEVREIFTRFHIVSNLQAPIFVDGNLFGQLSIDDCRSERDWTAIEQESLSVLADLIGAAIARQRHLEKLANADSVVRNSQAIAYRLSTATSPPRFTYVSDNVHLLGIEPARAPTDIDAYISRVHPDDRDSVKTTLKAATTGTGTAGTIEFRIADAGGNYHWVENRYKPTHDASGQLVEVSGVLIDVTERRLAEERLQFANTLLETLRDTSPDAILVVDASRKVIAFNHQFVELWRLPPELLGSGTDVAALAVASRNMKHPEAFKSRVEYLYLHPEDSAREDVETADGRFFDQNTAPLRTADGIYLGRVWFYRDVTARRRAIEAAQATLRRARDQMHVIGTISKSEVLLSGDIEHLARQITEHAAKVVGCERANVWLFNEDESKLRCIDLYEASSGRHSAGLMLDENQYRNEFQALKDTTHVAADDALTDPRTAGYVESYLKPLRITSMLDTVIRVGARNLGLLCLEHVDKPHHWTQDEIAFALQLADKIGIGIVNQQRLAEEEKRRVSEVALAEAQEVAHLGSWAYDPINDTATYSDESYRILGVDPATFPRTYDAYLSRIHPDDRVIFKRAFADSIANHDGYTCEYRVVMDDGGIKWIHDNGRNDYDKDGRHVRTVGTIQDITERKCADEQIARMAHFDHLTGLANRVVFVGALDHAIRRARRQGKSFAVLYLDLDHFKDINDTLGHPIGDRLLQKAADSLRTCVRATDTVARFGGDEFAIVQTDIEDPTDAASLAEKVLNALSTPFIIDGNEIRSGTSIGIAVYGPDSAEAEKLLSQADVALYRAKSEGRGTYRFFTQAMDNEVRTRVTIGADLRKAIANGELFLVYQPQVDAASGRIVGLEALIRWNHPTRGVISPGEFIKIAERNGLIVMLGNWVIREACRQTKIWIDAGMAPASVAVNLSALQFKTPRELENDIAASLIETGLPANILELELTESVLMEASHEHNDVLLRLRSAGFRLAIDDFGTGFSSLDYLRRFPVDRIKIAQNFIRELSGSSGNAAIVRAALGLARELGIETVVEGVETPEQLELLKSWGARTVQGFYFSKPLPAAEITRLLKKGRIIRPVPAAAAETAVA
ncbi:MAG TPA: EAL domain-containing protein [Pseudolabrys sp.]|nr:EAL domain-containing protein [Pseudolabrys sp.]